MNPLTIFFAIFISFCSNTIAVNIPSSSRRCPCYTATTYQPGIFCPTFKPSPPCVHLQCLVLHTTTTTIPAHATHCPTTSTVIELLDCQTACDSGCPSTTVTVTATTAAVCTTKATPKATITPKPYVAES